MKVKMLNINIETKRVDDKFKYQLYVLGRFIDER